ncbi:outer membrane protein (porin) [Caballeronia sordidicola]|uniref:Outer membrane protein (Porin) n=1 Tax=Caballeronia sordidicola TaxID=196367 RepID=A0A158HQ63_CABSO|nr:porin [Caballeronia sordidicola]SAL46213.1 outer membrane protein (porin) [Caballeronia sordidicola]
MKIRINCLVICFGALAGNAYAQSSVTLYGIVDAGFTYNTNSGGHSQIALTSGNGAGNRWGLKGTEDLGGGLAAVFELENGFSIVNGSIGQGGTFFGRHAYVGLSSRDYGVLLLGRQTALSNDYVGRFASGSSWAAAGTGYGAHVGDIDNLVAVNRTNNTVKYRTPDWRGLTAAGAYALGGVAGDYTRNQIWQAALNYANGPVNLAATYLVAKDPNYSFFGNTAKGSATATNLGSTPAYAGFANAGIQSIFAAGGQYKLGALMIDAVYSNVQFSDLGATSVTGLTPKETAYRGKATFNTEELNLMYYLSPSFMVAAAYNYTKMVGPDGEHAHYSQVNAGARYFLSKSTGLYLVGVWQRAGGTDSTGKPAVATISSVTPSTGRSQLVVTAGLTKRF